MAIILFSLGLSGIAQADTDSNTARRLQQAGDILALEVILDKVRAWQPGRVLEVELEQEHGSYVYEIEILDDEGLVHKLYLDARSGALLKNKKDD